MNKSRDRIHFNNLRTINKDEKIVYCKNCTMSNQRPRIQFNEEGICSACVYHNYKNQVIDWDKREKELEELCDKHRSKDGSWDVIVPGSGGTALLTLWILLSVLVKVPSFSKKVVPGRTTVANFAVSLINIS